MVQGFNGISRTTIANGGDAFLIVQFGDGVEKGAVFMMGNPTEVGENPAQPRGVWTTDIIKHRRFNGKVFYEAHVFNHMGRPMVIDLSGAFNFFEE